MRESVKGVQRGERQRRSECSAGAPVEIPQIELLPYLCMLFFSKTRCFDGEDMIHSRSSGLENCSSPAEGCFVLELSCFEE